MKHICMIGNSHVAPLFRAYKSMSDKPPATIAFYAIPGGAFSGTGMFNIRREDGVLTGFPQQGDKKHPAVSLDQYDQFIIAGGFPPPQQYMTLAKARISVQCRAAAEHDISTDNHAAHVIRLIRELSSAPIHVLTNIYPLGKASQSATAYKAAVQKIQSSLDPLDASLVPQSGDTLTQNYFTKESCMISRDDLHLNARGAQYALTDLFNQICPK